MKKGLLKYYLGISSIIIYTLAFSGCTSTPNEPVNATEATSTTDMATTSPSESTTTLPEGIAYIMEDGTNIPIDLLISPINEYNLICTTGDSSHFSNVFPEDVLTAQLALFKFEDIDTYATQLKNTFVSVYGEVFSMSNDFVSCTLLSEDELTDFITFYLDKLNVEIAPEYAFINETTYTITYTDEEGIEQVDSEIDYYITYSIDGRMYIDYLYIDTLDL